MRKPTSDGKISKHLTELLGDVRDALKTGEYHDLDRLASQQETLLTKLLAKPDGQPDISRASFEDLIANAKRNQTLITAALGGIKSAIRRHEDVLGLGEATQTYDRTGHRTKLAPATAELEKRS